MDPTPFVPVGRIVKTHGLAGEVSVAAAEGLLLDRLVGAEVWFVPPPAAVRTARISAVRNGPKGPLVTFDGIDDVDTAAQLRGCSIVARPDDVPDRPEPSEDDTDPIGLEVLDDERGSIGMISDVIVTGANDVWIVEGGPFGQVLVPVIDQVVESVDRDAGTVRVRLLPGLIEDE